MKLRLAGTIPESVVDGPGIRMVIFVQGCPHHCAGCHNPDTWDFGGGSEADTDELLAAAGRPGLVAGVTFSGGEPFAQAEALGELAASLKVRGFHLTAYSGYTWDELSQSSDHHVAALLRLLDLLVDGPFVASLRSGSLAFRGSQNQRIIRVPESLKAGCVVLDPRYHDGVESCEVSVRSMSQK